MSQISDILKIFPLKSRTYENGYKNYSANCFCKFKGLQLTFQVVINGIVRQVNLVRISQLRAELAH
jgi:hypothetical protein